MASYLLLRDRRELPYVAAGLPAPPLPALLPVRQSGRGPAPKQIEGKRVGLRTWQTTAGLWMRGILEGAYGVDIRSIEWITQDKEDIALEPPAGFTLRRVREDEDLDTLLVNGELAGLL
jgi:hypothetical protein